MCYCCLGTVQQRILCCSGFPVAQKTRDMLVTLLTLSPRGTADVLEQSSKLAVTSQIRSPHLRLVATAAEPFSGVFATFRWSCSA
jgi:hypothetical protein